MLRRRTFVLAAAVGLLAVTSSGAGAETASRLPYDFVLASYTSGDGRDSVFVNAWKARERGRTHGVIRLGSPPQTSRTCITVLGNEAFVMGELREPGGGRTLVYSLLLRDNHGTGKPDEYRGIHQPQPGGVPRVCWPYDGLGKGIPGFPVSSGDINIHDG